MFNIKVGRFKEFSRGFNEDPIDLNDCGNEYLYFKYEDSVRLMTSYILRLDRSGVGKASVYFENSELIYDVIIPDFIFSRFLKTLTFK